MSPGVHTAGSSKNPQHAATPITPPTPKGRKKVMVKQPLVLVRRILTPRENDRPGRSPELPGGLTLDAGPSVLPVRSWRGGPLWSRVIWVPRRPRRIGLNHLRIYPAGGLTPDAGPIRALPARSWGAPCCPAIWVPVGRIVYPDARPPSGPRSHLSGMGRHPALDDGLHGGEPIGQRCRPRLQYQR